MVQNTTGELINIFGQSSKEKKKEIKIDKLAKRFLLQFTNRAFYLVLVHSCYLRYTVSIVMALIIRLIPHSTIKGRTSTILPHIAVTIKKCVRR